MFQGTVLKELLNEIFVRGIAIMVSYLFIYLIVDFYIEEILLLYCEPLKNSNGLIYGDNIYMSYNDIIKTNYSINKLQKKMSFIIISVFVNSQIWLFIKDGLFKNEKTKIFLIITGFFVYTFVAIILVLSCLMPLILLNINTIKHETFTDLMITHELDLNNYIETIEYFILFEYIFVTVCLLLIFFNIAFIYNFTGRLQYYIYFYILLKFICYQLALLFTLNFGNLLVNIVFFSAIIEIKNVFYYFTLYKHKLKNCNANGGGRI